MTWTGQTFNVGQILTAAQMNNMQADITAVANGDAGAPPIVDAALGTTATTTGRDWVLARNALATADAVGSYAFAHDTADQGFLFGETTAASNLRPADGAGSSSGTMSGTWRCMGFTNGSTLRATSFLRIS